MKNLGSSQKSKGVSWLDITLLVILTMFWFLINQVWKESLAGIMFTVSFGILLIYIISMFTGFLSWMKLTVPTWTMSGLISLVVWQFYLTVIPTSNASSLAQDISQGILSKLFSNDSIVRLLQIWLFPVTESLFITFLFALFWGVASIKSKGLGDVKKNAIIPLLIIALFGGIIHVTVASQLATTGVIGFNESLFQQFLSFMIFIFTGLVFGAPGVLSSHIIKGLLIFGTFGWILMTFAVFIFIDILSIYMGSKSNTNIIKTPNFS